MEIRRLAHYAGLPSYTVISLLISSFMYTGAHTDAANFVARQQHA